MEDNESFLLSSDLGLAVVFDLGKKRSASTLTRVTSASSVFIPFQFFMFSF